MKVKMLFLFSLVLCLGQIVFAQGETNLPSTPLQADQPGYLIGPGDIVEVKVLGEDAFNFIATVDEDGRIQVPYSEAVAAKCTTEKGLRQQVVKAYSRLLKNPQVSLFVKERNRPPATIYGEVVKPQQVILTRKATLRELLAFSGGVTKEASGMIQITRTQPIMCAEGSEDDWKTASDKGIRFPTSIFSYSSLRDTNPVIYPGDIVDVQKAAPVYIVGEVLKPEALPMPEGGLPLMQAIAMVSGTTRDAKLKEVKIYRRKQGSIQPEVILINYAEIKKGTQKDVMLEPLDIVEVGKAKKSVFDIVLDIATGTARNAATQVVRY